MRAALLILFGGAAFSLAALPSVEVSADDIGPPPADCPYGTRPESSHAGPHCELLPACAVEGCPGGMACTPARFCVREVPCGGLRMRRDDAPPCTEQHVIGTCEGGASCAADAACVPHPVCLYTSVPVAEVPAAEVPAAEAPVAEAPVTEAPASPPPATEPAASGCSATRAGHLAPIGSLALALALLARRRA